MEKNFIKLNKETCEHSIRVANITRSICEMLNLSDIQTELYTKAALFHDIGKIKIPVEILEKDGKLTDEEYNEIKKHTDYSFDLVTKDIRDIVKYHHEQEDGSGYYGLTSELIPYGSKIIHVADVYDAITNKRCYKEAIDINTSIKIMESDFKKFDKEVFETLKSLVLEVECV